MSAALAPSVPPAVHSLQGVRDMGGQSSRYDEDRIEAVLKVAEDRIAADPELSRLCYARSLQRCDRRFGLIPGCPALDLHECQPPATHGDQIDLAVRGA